MTKFLTCYVARAEGEAPAPKIREDEAWDQIQDAHWLCQGRENGEYRALYSEPFLTDAQRAESIERVREYERTRSWDGVKNSDLSRYPISQSLRPECATK